jgi:hypothetical protein
MTPFSLQTSPHRGATVIDVDRPVGHEAVAPTPDAVRTLQEEMTVLCSRAYNSSELTQHSI